MPQASGGKARGTRASAAEGRGSARAAGLAAIARDVVACRLCPRLVAHREAAAGTPPLRFRGQKYWARPLPGFGDPAARLVIVGLAPAAHGGNRTGRMFTGDSSGDWLFAALHRAGYANQPQSVSRADGLLLVDAYVTAAVRCAPPDNRPTPGEFRTCRPYLSRELAELRGARVAVALGGLAWDSLRRALEELGAQVPRPYPPFAHGARVALRRGAGERPLTILGSYHVSRQNTNTGRLTREMLDDVFTIARAVSSAPD